MGENQLRTFRSSNFPSLGEKPPGSLPPWHPVFPIPSVTSPWPPMPQTPMPILRLLWYLILTVGVPQARSYPLLNSNTTTTITTTLNVSHSYAIFSRFLYLTKAIMCPCPTVVSAPQRRKQTQRSSITYPSWVPRPALDRARQSGPTASAHNHFPIPVVLNGAILPLRGRLEVPGDILVVTTGGY